MRACCSAKNAAGSASVCPQAHMATSRSAPATTTGRPRKVAPSALDSIASSPFLSSFYFLTSKNVVLPLLQYYYSI